jgi:hypothetical protein
MFVEQNTKQMKHQTTKQTRQLVENFCSFIALSILLSGMFAISLLIASKLF